MISTQDRGAGDPRETFLAPLTTVHYLPDDHRDTVDTSLIAVDVKKKVDLDATENVVIIFRLQSCGTVPNQAKLDE
jgi:hypothetical protein